MNGGCFVAGCFVPDASLLEFLRWKLLVTHSFCYLALFLMFILVLSHMVSNLSFMLPIDTNWFYIYTNKCYFIIRDLND